MSNATGSGFLTRGATSPRHAAYLQALRLRQLQVAGVQILVFILFLAIWQIATMTGLVDPFIISQPSQILEKLAELTGDGSLGYHIAITVWETLAGFFIGTIGGIIIAGMFWWWRFLSDVADPYVVVLNATPKMALGPVFIIWLGASIAAVIALAVSISLFVTILSVHSAFQQSDRDKLLLASSFGASRWQQFIKVVLPGAVPTIIAT
ncbi:ABC transporter permease, partial [Pseudorhodoplanes sp.]|uniref:ABC transporter permease n=1 Tax=Pseudorhodoplanes sp. TaxID=1934341 RepID=UPI003D0C9D25